MITKPQVIEYLQTNKDRRFRVGTNRVETCLVAQMLSEVLGTPMVCSRRSARQAATADWKPMPDYLMQLVNAFDERDRQTGMTGAEALEVLGETV
jgi:hypothetical protein